MLEREVKLRFDTPAEARAAVVAAGATPIHARRLQQDSLLDTDAESLRRERNMLRIRRDGPASILTFKGPVQPGPMKLREELETAVADGDRLREILDRLGLRAWFHYEKYREEFTADGVIIAVDETPVGTFVEIEGTSDGITRMAAAMGKGTSDYILDSYYRLFMKTREALGFKGQDMVFDDPGRS
ncbi:MAG: class IV adenylate cyclase [Acidobacteria bacterium]|nr:class IV adenylate cyclase [Acidobacteriota bacterium]